MKYDAMVLNKFLNEPDTDIVKTETERCLEERYVCHLQPLLSMGQRLQKNGWSQVTNGWSV